MIDVKIGAFPDNQSFFEDIFGQPDHVYREFDGGTSGSYGPLITAAPGTGGAYTLDLPEDPSTIRIHNVIAWVDTDADGQFDLGTEAGYFPVKTIESNLETIKGFGYYSSGGTVLGYLVGYGGANNTELGILGTTGFDFNVD